MPPIGSRSLSGFPGTPTGRRLVNADGTPRVCLISGAASGIGRASALRIASEGGIPIIADLPLQEAAGKKVAEEANTELPKGTKEKAMFVTLDVTNEEQWAAAIKVSKRGARARKLDNLSK